MVDVVRAHHRAGEALQEVVLFVGGAVAAEEPDAAGLGGGFLQAAGNEVQGFIPCDFNKRPVFLD